MNIKSNDQETELQLIKAIQAGELDLFKDLVLKYQNKIYRLFMRNLANPEACEDLSQEVFIKAYRSIKSFKFQSKFSTWLTQIAINTLITYKNSKNFRKSFLNQDLNEQSLILSETEIEQKNINQQKLSYFYTCLKNLKEKLSTTLTLVALENHSYEEAAEILRIPIGTIRSRLNQARLLLSECLNKNLGAL